MNSNLKYKVFARERSVDELLHSCNFWASDLEFFKIEISFLKKILTTFPFKSNIPNLFEKIQLFIIDLDHLNTIRETLLTETRSHNEQLKSKIKIKELSNDNEYLIRFDDLAEEVLDFFKEYKSLKMKIYEFVTGQVSG